MRCERQSIHGVLRTGVNQTNRNTTHSHWIRSELPNCGVYLSVGAHAVCLSLEISMHTTNHARRPIPWRVTAIVCCRFPAERIHTIYIKLMPPKYHRITGTTFQSTLFGCSCSCLYNFSYLLLLFHSHFWQRTMFNALIEDRGLTIRRAAVTDTNIIMSFICYSLPLRHWLRPSTQKIMNGILIESGLPSSDPGR